MFFFKLTSLQARPQQAVGVACRCAHAGVVDPRKMLIRAASGHHAPGDGMLGVGRGVVRGRRLAAAYSAQGAAHAWARHATRAVRHR